MYFLVYERNMLDMAKSEGKRLDDYEPSGHVESVEEASSCESMGYIVRAVGLDSLKALHRHKAQEQPGIFTIAEEPELVNYEGKNGGRPQMYIAVATVWTYQDQSEARFKVLVNPSFPDQYFYATGGACQPHTAELPKFVEAKVYKIWQAACSDDPDAATEDEIGRTEPVPIEKHRANMAKKAKPRSRKPKEIPMDSEKLEALHNRDLQLAANSNLDD